MNKVIYIASIVFLALLTSCESKTRYTVLVEFQDGSKDTLVFVKKSDREIVMDKGCLYRYSNEVRKVPCFFSPVICGIRRYHIISKEELLK